MGRRLSRQSWLTFLRSAGSAVSAASLPPNRAGAINGSFTANLNIRKIQPPYQRQCRNARFTKAVIFSPTVVGVLVVFEFFGATNSRSLLQHQRHVVGQLKRTGDECTGRND